MSRFVRALNYFGEIISNNISNSSHLSGNNNNFDLELCHLTGNYSACHFQNAVTGFGLHANGYLHISIDNDIIRHHNNCGNWMQRIAAYFQISSNYISFIRAPRPSAFYANYKSVAVGHKNLTARNSYGTMGGFIAPKVFGDSYRIISNNHVLADSNGGLRGDTIYAMGNTPYKIAALEKYVPIYKELNYLDLAVAKLEGFQPASTPSLSQSRPGKIGEPVTKYGATTGFTQGKIASTQYTTVVNYNGASVLFKNQLMITSTVANRSFSQGGDSGSMIKSKENNFIGLLFAGNDVQTFANHSTTVIGQLSQWGYL